MFHLRKLWFFVAAAVVFHPFVWVEHAASADRTSWATDAEFRQRLTEPVDFLWSGNPLRDAVTSLSRAQQVPILIDRRVDPGQRLELQVRGEPMQSALETIAKHCGLGISRLGTVIYLGPPMAAERLPRVVAKFAESVRQLPTAAQRKFAQRKSLRWNDLATPRELLDQLSEQSGLEIAGLDQVPHDLWAAADLPPLSLIDRLSLIAIQFDLTFQIDASGTRLTLVLVPHDLALPPNRPQPIHVSKSLKQTLGSGGTDSLQRVRIQRLAVKDKPLIPVLRQLASQLGLELQIDEKAIAKASISLDQRVSMSIENATIDEVLRQLLDSTGLQFQRSQRVVKISPAK